ACGGAFMNKDMNRQNRRRAVVAFAAAGGSVFAGAGAVRGATPMSANTWTAATDNWSVPANWSLGHSPTNTGAGEIGIVNNGGTVQVNASTGSVTAGGLCL